MVFSLLREQDSLSQNMHDYTHRATHIINIVDSPITRYGLLSMISGANDQSVGPQFVP